MYELSVGDFSLRRPPMVAFARCIEDIEGVMTLQHSENEFVQKNIQIINALAKGGHIELRTEPQGVPVPSTYNVKKNFKDSLGTLFARENKKLYFEIQQPYELEFVEGGFFRKKVERKRFMAYITITLPFVFDQLVELRLKGDRIYFKYSSAPPEGEKVLPPPPSHLKAKMAQTATYVFETPEIRTFVRDLYEWAERKGFRLPKPIDEDKRLPELTKEERKIEKPLMGSLEEELAKLTELMNKGIITREEYESSKQRLMQDLAVKNKEFPTKKIPTTPTAPPTTTPPATATPIGERAAQPLPPPPPPSLKCSCGEMFVYKKEEMKWFCEKCKKYAQ